MRDHKTSSRLKFNVSFQMQYVSSLPHGFSNFLTIIFNLLNNKRYRNRYKNLFL